MTREEFFAQFELFAELPGAVAKMRELVLELATTGRIVLQQQSDGAVDTRSLSAQKVPQIASKGRGGTSFDNVEEGDIIARVPDSWRAVRLFRLCDSEAPIAYGILQAGPNVRPEGVPYVRPTEMKANGILLDKVQHTTPEIATQYARSSIRTGDILLSIVGTVGSTAVVPPELDGGNINQSACRIRADLRFVDVAFLVVCLRSPTLFRQYAEVMFGSAVRRLNIAHVRALIIPLPPLAEQKRIVAKVDELMALCDRLEAQQKERETRHAALARASLSRFADAPTPANLTFLFHNSYTIAPADLRKSILTLAVQGKLVPQIAEAPLVSLNSILAEASVNGVSKGPTSDSGATEVLRISAGTSRNDFYVDENDFKHVDLSPNEMEKYQLAPGDLLACRFNGNLHYVGRFSVYRGDSQRVQVNPDKLIRFRVDAARCNARYVCYAMNASPTRASIERMCATTAGNIGLSAGRLKTVEIPIPPLPEQRRIVTKVDQLTALVDELETQLAASRATAAKLLDAIVGELTA